MKSEIGSDVKRSVREKFAAQLERGILVTCEDDPDECFRTSNGQDLSEHNESANPILQMPLEKADG